MVTDRRCARGRAVTAVRPFRAAMNFLEELSFEFQRPAKVQLDLTNACNLDCAYCYNKASAFLESREMSDDEVAAVVSKIAGELDPVVVTFSGGEPLLRRELLLRSLRALKRHDIAVWLNTNGLRIDRRTAAELRDGGIDRVSINIESLAPGIHDSLRGRKGSLDRAARALDLLSAAIGAERISISCVVTRANMPMLSELARFVRDRGFHELHLLDMIPTHTAEASLVPDAADWRAFYETFDEIRAAGARVNPNHALLFLRGFDREFVFPFCMAGRLKMVICANGDIVPCNYFKSAQSVCGNALRDNLLAVWTESETMRAFRHSLDGYQRCSGCAHLTKCAGGCKALSNAMCGTPFTPDPYCSRYGLCDVQG